MTSPPSQGDQDANDGSVTSHPGRSAADDQLHELSDRLRGALPTRRPDADGVAFAYRLFLGRPPESDEVVAQKAGLSTLAFFSSFLESPEFHTRVVDKLLACERLVGGEFDATPSPRLKAWICESCPLAQPSLPLVRSAGSWEALHRAILCDPFLHLLGLVDGDGAARLRALESDRPRRPFDLENGRIDADLQPGDHDYRAYVGPPDQYDLMGASQFMLMVSLGLRAAHRVLDFGCGSLRVGRLLIPYLDRGNYTGIEPNSWLIEEGLAHHLGAGVVRVKWPQFCTANDFRADRAGSGFDFILAQSILSHTAADLLPVVLTGFERAVGDDGLVLATVIHDFGLHRSALAASGWIYPQCVAFTAEQFQDAAQVAGLSSRALPWFHPRQSWYALARDPGRLPPPEADAHLSGTIVGQPGWSAGTPGH